jgi:hypothetical protein
VTFKTTQEIPAQPVRPNFRPCRRVQATPVLVQAGLRHITAAAVQVTLRRSKQLQATHLEGCALAAGQKAGEAREDGGLRRTAAERRVHGIGERCEVPGSGVRLERAPDLHVPRWPWLSVS